MLESRLRWRPSNQDQGKCKVVACKEDQKILVAEVTVCRYFGGVERVWWSTSENSWQASVLS